MSVKEDIGAECGDDDDEWGDLITTPNRLIPDEFFVLKAEEMDDLQVDDEKSRSVSDTERRAAIPGSDCINGSRIRVSVSSSPATAWSQLLTSSSGFTLDSLPDSPIMLPNSQGSPTTGTFTFPPLNHELLGMNSAVDDSSSDSNSLANLPHEGSLLWPSVSDLQNLPPVLSQFPGPLPNGSVTKGSAIDLHSPEDFKALKSTTHNANGTAVQPTHTDNQTSPTRQSKETNVSNMRNSEDGYNWRKYGQKQVKGSEYPRSYYKCTHPNCQVKKKVERSHDGHITEIIYKGAHNHQGQRNFIGSTEANGSYIKIGDSEVWGNIQQGGTNNIAICQTQDGMELASSTSVVTDNSDLISVNQRKSMGIYGNPELSSTNAIYDINEDGTHIGTLSPGDEVDEDKSDLKRRKKGNFLLETSLVTRAMREPRVVVQIESEIDILDDGYRWRKYGQKVVKGNPNPRSYYKCTTTGCPVRKHVERASDDLKSVLTTYEGKHNHELPAARNSTHSHATMDHGSTTNTPNQPLSKISNVPKSEPQGQDLPLRHDRKLSSDYITSSSFIGNFDTEPTKYVTFQNPLSFNSVLPDFPISLPMTIPPSANMVPNGFGFNSNGKRARDVHSFVGGQGRDINNGRYLKPKLEQDDVFFDTFMRAPDHVNDASSRYCRALPSFQS